MGAGAAHLDPAKTKKMLAIVQYTLDYFNLGNTYLEQKRERTGLYTFLLRTASKLIRQKMIVFQKPTGTSALFCHSSNPYEECVTSKNLSIIFHECRCHWSCFYFFCNLRSFPLIAKSTCTVVY